MSQALFLVWELQACSALSEFNTGSPMVGQSEALGSDAVSQQWAQVCPHLYWTGHEHSSVPQVWPQERAWPRNKFTDPRILVVTK